MTLTAPEHLRGRISNKRTALLAERAEWIRQVKANGCKGTEIAAALGISYNAAREAAAKAGCGHVSHQTMNVLWKQGIKIGPPKKTVDGMSVMGRARLADEAARTGKPLLHVMADFWEQHHGAQA